MGTVSRNCAWNDRGLPLIYSFGKRHSAHQVTKYRSTASCMSLVTMLLFRIPLCVSYSHSATHIIRASPLPPLGPHGSPPSYDGSPALTIIHVLNHLISSSVASSPAQTRACYILGRHYPSIHPSIRYTHQTYSDPGQRRKGD